MASTKMQKLEIRLIDKQAQSLVKWFICFFFFVPYFPLLPANNLIS